ncbi:MAG: TrkH family potassium uptake protein [Ruminococcaceae bacterium]|nr:TrkH family potassium uptake protein [Oscillospiraceae bacterium]
MNYRMITYILGWILLFESAFLLIPSIAALVFMETAGYAFLMTIGICLLVSALLIFKKPKNTDLHSRDGFVIVSLSWIVLSLFGALPFVLSGVTTSYVDAFFETVSGFTTTGASIFTAVEALPKCILLWRSFTHWVGGMGVLVFIMAFLPLSGGRNMHIMKAESPGPSVSKLVPRVRTTALLLYTIYFALTLLQFILLLCGGMSIFDALNTSFATAGTGGFGIKNDSIGGYSPYLQIVIGIFMLLFSLNFNSYFLILKGKLKDAFNAEIRTFLLIVAGAVAAITWNIRHMFGSLGEALRHAFFAVSTIISTTGFATTDFDLWPQLSRTVLVLLMFIGACAGSTGGGIKISRIMIIFKTIFREIRTAIHPKQIKKISMDGKAIESDVVRSTVNFFACFVMIFAISWLAISFDNYDFTTNFTAVAATIGNIGPGLSAVGPTCNYAFFSNFSKLVLSFDMLAGRLELFPMLVLFSPATWKKY